MGSKRKRSRKYDRISDDKMKGHTKRNQNQPTEIPKEDEIHEENESNEEEEIDSSTDRNKLEGIKNLMDFDEQLLLNQIPSKDMIYDNTIKKHCQNMRDKYFKDKSIFGQTKLFVKLFRRKDMRHVLELLGVDNRKSHVHNINKTIVENLQNAYNKIDNTTRGGDMSNACRALMTTISSRKLTQRKKKYMQFLMYYIYLEELSRDTLSGEIC